MERLAIVDCFAGGGGASNGIERALGRAPTVAINHDPDAIALHRANHPETLHLTTSIWNVDPDEIVRDHGPVGLLWASPDCKHFSKAKGGRPVKRTIRDLAWTVVLWARRARPIVICLENVEEFRDWGPVNRDGRPCPERKGQTFDEWVGELERLGYAVEWKELRACDYGAPTIRKRLFLVARRDGQPIVWPEPTHAPADSPAVASGDRMPYRTAAEIIDWSQPCPSIFLDRDGARRWYEATGQRVNRPLKDPTMRRIARGVVRYVLEAADPFIVTLNHGGDWQRGWSLKEPFKTVTAARDAHALITPMITRAQHGGACRDIKDPLHTITASTKDQNAVIAPVLVPRYGERAGQAPRIRSVQDPIPTVVPTGNGAQLVAAFLAQHNGPGGGRRGEVGNAGHDARKPVSTITQRGTQQGVVAAHLVNMKGADRRSRSIDAPLSTICAGGNHAGLISAFLFKYYGTDQDPRLSEPLHTITTKDRFGLVTLEIGGEAYVIVDIGMRMLTPRELFRAQGFADSYQICERADGTPITKTTQTRCVGNSVCPDVAAAVVAANCDFLVERKLEAA
ncbi:DNA cytosine methyltransferase [Hyphobacterium sp.]|uniref:DNA cytosine methyltransferase n=1 Tax=Hyphobacterium sp. TaxID=2004662 RepID=UPI003B52CA07